MSNRDHLERNIERLLRAVRPELELPEEKKEEILANLAAEAAAISSKDSTGSSWTTVVLRHPATIAAAVVLMIGILAGAAWLSRYIGIEQTEQFATQPKSIIEETITDEKEPDDELIAEDVASQKAQIQARLKQIAAMFDTGNIKGLTAKLSDKNPELRIAAANYLAQIGDFAAVEPLLEAGKEWTGLEADNPFVNAIYQIMLRMSRQQAQVIAEKEQQEPNEPRKVISPTITAKEPPKPGKKTVTYSGVVSNEAGEPVKDVYVRSFSYNQQMEFSGTESEGWTNENGLFRVGPVDASNLDKIDRTLIFDHPDYAIGWFHTKRGRQTMRQDGIEISLLNPSIVAGTVMDRQGAPVEGAIVEAMVQVKSAEQSSVLMMWNLFGMGSNTDTQGQFAFNNIPDKARLHIDVRHSAYAHYSTRFGYTTDDYPIRAGQEDLIITLKPGGFIRGRLVMNGKPYEKEGVAIFVQGEKGHTISRTNEMGQFETTGLAQGGYTIKALDDEFEKKGLISPTLTDVMVEVTQEPTEVELVLAGGVSVTVRVIDEQTGAPVNNVWVRAGPRGAENITVADGRTNAEGLCILKVSTGEYVIKAQGWMNGRLNDFSEDVRVGTDDKDLIVEIAITPRRIISGLLIDTGGKPVAGTASLGSDSTAAGMDGRFELPQPWGDEMQVHIGFAFDETRQIGRAFYWQKSDDINDLVIILEPVAIITGRVVFEDGTSVDQAEPKLWTSMPSGGWQSGGGNNPWKLNIIGNGEFQFENIPTGLEMDVHAEIPGFQGMANVGELMPGETTDVGDLVLKALAGFKDEQVEWTGILKGRVTNENNEPMIGFRVDASIGTQQFSDVTDTQGRYILTGLPEGKNISGSVYAAGYGHTIFKAVVDSNDLDIQMFPQEWNLLDKQAPALLVEKWINTEPVILEQYRGKVVLLQVGVLLPNYSSDLELTQRMIGKYAVQGLEVIAVHQPLDVTWAGAVTETDIAEYITRHNIIYPFGIDEDTSGNGATYSLYDVKATPALYLIDKEGFIRISPKRNELDKWIDQLLAE